MIYCSHCGTQNQDGSKFCGNCAARLVPPSGLVCPMCSTSNPVENVFCSNCGARLVPHEGGAGAELFDSAPPIRGLSLPAKPASPPASSSEGEIKETKPEINKETGDETEEAPVTREKIEDWLTKLRESPPVEDESAPLPPAPASTSAPAKDMPSWVHQVQSQDEQTPPEPSMAEEPDSSAKDQAPIAPSQNKPDWLRELTDETGLRDTKLPADERTPASPFQTPIDELPSWLKIASEEKHEVGEPPTIREERKEEPPPKPPIIEPVELEAIEPARAEEIPSWVAELKPTDDQPAAAPEPFPEEAEPEREPLEPARAEEIPPWIAELKPTEDQVAAPPQLPQVAAEPVPQPLEPARAEEIPVWIAELKPTVEEPAEPAPEFEAEVHTEELADWLRTPQFGSIVPIAPLEFEREPAEISGPLANLRGILPLATAIVEPHPVVQAPPTEKKDGAHIFEEILAETHVQIPRPARRRVRQGLLAIRPMIYASLALSIILALFIPPGFSGILLPISGTSAAEFYDTIESLPSNSTVFVSFDYDPSLSGEMDLVSVAILRHLIQRRINIVALSTLEMGPMIAQRVLATATTESRNYRYGTNFINAGFVPGHEAGLAQLATQGFSSTALDFDQNQLISRYPIGANIKNIKSVQLVIELAGAEEPLRSWIEQFETRVPVRLAAGASAAVEPKARTYRDANQLTALVSGPIGAAQYEILTKQPGEAVRRSTAQSFAQVVLIMVVLAGNAALWISRTMDKT